MSAVGMGKVNRVSRSTIHTNSEEMDCSGSSNIYRLIQGFTVCVYRCIPLSLLV